jgi:hypothetical protein
VEQDADRAAFGAGAKAPTARYEDGFLETQLQYVVVVGVQGAAEAGDAHRPNPSTQFCDKPVAKQGHRPIGEYPGLLGASEA